MRHAAYEGHRPGHHAPPDAPLSAEGRAQIHRALPLPEGITAIVTSPLLRARQTADLLSELTGIPVIDTTPLLAEWHAPSIVIGRTSETYPPEYRAWREQRAANPSLACGDGESPTDLYARANRCVDRLLRIAESQGRAVLAVSHKVLLGVLVRLAEGPGAFDASIRAAWPFAELSPMLPYLHDFNVGWTCRAPGVG
ncbi:histidine phosphatase family protein [Actinacidiphila guanduensis]|uniref:histidine phosphatase family protein n=1 Tax=Actinacidiphila guanduensis TaxID=310781 RepID=UPI001FE6FFB4|nr:histidine phosphatase family protein [Actinacidiphila guanduensis]